MTVEPIVKLGLFLLMLSLISSCSNGVSPSDEASQEQFPAFTNFPQQQFYTVYLGQDTKEAEAALLNQGFILRDEAGSRYYYKSDDSTEVILCEKSTLNSFKIFLRSHDYLRKQKELLDRFKIASVESVESADFSIYDYAISTGEFKLTVFSQSDYIRLNFELKQPK